MDNKWNGTTAKEAAFSANLVCWNCGAPGHSMNNCPKPKNAAKIKQASEKFCKELKKKRKAKKKSTPPADASSKHSPPTEAERRRRVINGVPMFFLPTAKRWVKDRYTTANLASTTVPSTVQTDVSTTSTGHDGQSTVIKSRRPLSAV